MIAPLREIEIRDKAAPWITWDIKVLQRRRSKLYRIYRRSGFTFKEYVEMHKVINRKITDAKKCYFDRQFRDCKNARLLWNDFRNLGLVKRTDSTTELNLNLNNLNDFFVSAAGPSLQNTDSEYLNACVVKCDISFTFKTLTPAVVRKACMRLTSGSVGPDGFQIKTY